MNETVRNDIPLIELKNATLGYGTQAVLSGIDLSIGHKETVALIGENGSGKSTLLKTIIKEIPPLNGSVLICGREIKRLSAHEIARTMAVVMTERIYPDYYTCFDMVCAGRYPYTDSLGRLTKEDRDAVEEAMSFTGTKDLSDRYVTDISDGQRQLIMLSRAIAQEPDILILDEPTSFLDIKHKFLFAEAVGELVEKRQISVLMSMHEIDLVREMAGRFVALKDGVIDRDGDTSDLNDGYISSLFGLDGINYRKYHHS